VGKSVSPSDPVGINETGNPDMVFGVGSPVSSPPDWVGKSVSPSDPVGTNETGNPDLVFGVGSPV